jgi:DMSO/TMAO reductase YedYZ molybdopterin-dependent catalytic subunit
MPEPVHPEAPSITRRDLLRGLAVAGFVPPHRFTAGVAAAPAAWRIRVRGLVDRPLDLALADLDQLGGTTTPAFVECAGSGSVRTATWTGVPLRTVLDAARVRGDPVAVVATGVDGHRRAIPLRDVEPSGALLAWAQDGEALPAPRLLVPGWAGEASVKRIVALEVVDRAPVEPPAADPADRRLRPLREMPPRAVILSPDANGIIRAGWQAMRGVAWSGYAPIVSVAVTTDGGASWVGAGIVQRAGPRGWVTFRAAWDAAPGPALLAARATDAVGLTQPIDVPERALGFVRNAVNAVTVTVR